MTTTEFTTKTGNKITFYDLKEKECPRCLEIFLPKHPITVYCNSDECKKIHWSEQYQKNSPTFNRQNKLPKKNCKICNKEFQPRSLSNKGICGSLDCRYEQRKIHNKTNKSRLGHDKKHHYHTKKIYGLSNEQYEEMEKYQNYSCKICGNHESLNGKDRNGYVKKLSVDHDHETKQIRGLLCNWCNIALGGFKDNIESLKNAIKYLEGSKNSKIYMPEKNIPKKKLE